MMGGSESVHFNNLDNHGNLSLGFSNFLFFPEIENNYEIFESLLGLQMTFVTKTNIRKRSSLSLNSFDSKNSIVNNYKQMTLLFSSHQLPFLS